MDKCDDIILSGINQPEKDNYCMVTIYEVSETVTFTRTESRMVVARD